MKTFNASDLGYRSQVKMLLHDYSKPIEVNLGKLQRKSMTNEKVWQA